MIEGRAWSGWAPVSLVEVCIDGGDDPNLLILNQHRRSMAGHVGRGGGRQAGLGSMCAVACRATDASGRAQPLSQRWSRGGFANNTIQRVPVIVISSEM